MGEGEGRGGRKGRREEKWQERRMGEGGGREGERMAGEEDGRGGRERRSSNVLFAHMI